MPAERAQAIRQAIESPRAATAEQPKRSAAPRALSRAPTAASIAASRNCHRCIPELSVHTRQEQAHESQPRKSTRPRLRTCPTDNVATGETLHKHSEALRGFPRERETLGAQSEQQGSKALESRQAQSERDSASGNDIAIAGNGNEGDSPSSALTDFSKRALEQACNDRTQPDAKKRTRRDCTDEEIECGLVAVAAANGNAARAAEVSAAEDGLEILQRMLLCWSRKQHLERYQRVRSEVLPKIRAEVADEYVALIASRSASRASSPMRLRRS